MTYDYESMKEIFDTLDKGYGELPLERRHRRKLAYLPG